MVEALEGANGIIEPLEVPKVRDARGLEDSDLSLVVDTAGVAEDEHCEQAHGSIARYSLT